MSTENIVSGKKYRILTDAVNKVYDRISFWTKSSDVYNNNDQNLETTCGSITGISDSLTSTSSNVAASAASVKALNDKITELSSNLIHIDFTFGNYISKHSESCYTDSSVTFNIEKCKTLELSDFIGDGIIKYKLDSNDYITVNKSGTQTIDISNHDSVSLMLSVGTSNSTSSCHVKIK